MGDYRSPERKEKAESVQLTGVLWEATAHETRQGNHDQRRLIVIVTLLRATFIRCKHLHLIFTSIALVSASSAANMDEASDGTSWPAVACG